MVRASALQTVDLGSIPLSSYAQDFNEASLLDAQHKRNSVEENLVSSLVSLKKALSEMPLIRGIRVVEKKSIRQGSPL